MSLTFSESEFEWVERSAKTYGVDRLSRHVKRLAIEAAKIGLGEQVERPPQISEEVVNDMLYVLYTCSNNINQIAYNLNVRAKEERRSPVAGERESNLILDDLFRILRELQTDISPLLAQTKTPS